MNPKANFFWPLALFAVFAVALVAVVAVAKPLASVAVTVNSCTPGVEVSIAAPLATGPLQADGPAPKATHE